VEQERDRGVKAQLLDELPGTKRQKFQVTLYRRIAGEIPDERLGKNVSSGGHQMCGSRVVANEASRGQGYMKSEMRVYFSEGKLAAQDDDEGGRIQSPLLGGLMYRCYEVTCK